jgi:hypothetical protein
MKTLSKWLASAMVAALTALFLFACSEPEVSPPDDDEPQEITPEKANALMEEISFASATKVTGAVPSVSNTSLVKMIGGDTIYTLPELQVALRVTNPPGRPAKGWYIAVEGSTFYKDVLVDDTEDGDTVTVVIMEFTNEDPEISTFPLLITPYDEQNQPIDVIKRIVVVENTTSQGGRLAASSCDLLMSPSSLANWDWSWRSTMTWNPNGEVTFMNSPGRLFTAEQNPTGCCNPQAACPAYVCNPTTQECQWVYNAEVFATTFYSISAEYFSFFQDGTFQRWTKERIKNFNPDPDVTDWCGGVAGYNDRTSVVEYSGTHDYQSGDPNVLYVNTQVECDDPLGICGYGSRPGTIRVSCHVLVITATIEFTKEERTYVRGSVDSWND